MTDKTTAMPELPEPELGYIETDKSRQPAFSARQMREALQSAQQAAAVSDEAIYAVWTQHCQTPGTTTRQLVCAFARAIPALSPAQQAPEWDGGKPANLQAAARDADEWLALIQRLNDAGRWLFSQPDSRPKLDGCRAALSKILCAPAQQAVPMTDREQTYIYPCSGCPTPGRCTDTSGCHEAAMGVPSYYVRHPDDTYTLAIPQPTLFGITAPAGGEG